MDIQQIKQRYGIIGNSSQLNLAIDIARQVAPTDLSVLITGESGTGKEVFPQIIHQLSARKHGPYIAVNCGAIPEGTIDSELFGHEKGSFTGAYEARKGYFEVVNGGTIFLDEIADMPLPTQARLLRVLESGEFIKVGSSKVLKTDVRVIAATNVNVTEAIQHNRFREDLFYRLNSVPISMPPLRERKDDIVLLFRKFASDFAEKYKMPAAILDEDAQELMMAYRWPGNIRQLKNITEQISIIEKQRNISSVTLSKYLPQATESKLPVLLRQQSDKSEISERDILYRVLFEMRKDITDLKHLVADIIKEGNISVNMQDLKNQFLQNYYNDHVQADTHEHSVKVEKTETYEAEPIPYPDVYEESLSLQEREIDLIKKALDKNHGKRKNAAKELGISERTLYRKIKEYNIDN
ncbi:MAG TPA: sigma-54 dependent transcriptional regulator [Bacteroidales bacterium]|nr:sigma-54 dependent transcriptional regulator [Bacteroidales bacterium]